MKRNTRCPEIEDILVDEFLRQRLETRDNSMTRISGSGDPLCKLWCRRNGCRSVPMTAHQMYTFSIGHALHEYWQKLCHRTGLSYAVPYMEEDGSVGFHGLAEVRVSDPEAQTMGHFDMLTAALARSGGRLLPGAGTTHYIIDFKTISDTPKVYFHKEARRPFRNGNGEQVSTYWKRLRFSSIEKEGAWLPMDLAEARGIPDGDGWMTTSPVRVEPGDFTKLKAMKDEHRLQASEYAYVINTYGLPEEVWPPGWDHAGRRDGRVWPKVGGIILIYLAKDHAMLDYEDPHDERNLPVKVFAEALSEPVVACLQTKYDVLNMHVATGKMPEKMTGEDGGPAHFPCHYCEYRCHCWPESYGPDGRPIKAQKKR